MDLTTLFVACVIVWFICGAMAARIAFDKKAESVGSWYGVLLGPFGVIAAGFLDNRVQCPRCSGRLNGHYAVCQHCGVELNWGLGKPLNPEMVERHRERESARPKFDEWGNPLDTAENGTQEGEAVSTASG